MYTCPMHPQVTSDGPGLCPECGMSLEATDPQAVDEDGELQDMRRRFFVGASLSLPLVIIAMGDMLPGQPFSRLLSPAGRGLIEILLATPVCFYAGAPFFVRAWISLKNRSTNMFTLIAIGVLCAYGYSFVAVLWPSLLPESTQAHHQALYFESAAVIVTLILLGQVLELRSRARTSQALRDLLELKPDNAWLVAPDGSSERQVPVCHVKVGDRLRIKPGGRVPVDGSVLEGHSWVDESMITGEPLAVEKSPSSQLVAGTINQKGSLLMEAKRVGSDTVLAQIVQLVQSAWRSRAPIQKQADQLAAYFVPAVLVVAALAVLMWIAVGEPLDFALITGVSVLIIACPCALGLATPMSIIVGSGRAARLGVLFRNGEALESLASIDTVVVDKTGTLTTGKPKLIKAVVIDPSLSEASFLARLGALERESEHPLATAILEATPPLELAELEVASFSSHTGLGISGQVAGDRLAVGNEAMMATVLAEPWNPDKGALELLAQGATVMYVARNGNMAGYVAVADQIRPSSSEAVSRLRAMGIDMVMVTGDHEKTALAVASQVGIHQVHAGVLPDGKAKIVTEIAQQGSKVAFIGDGINDAPALAQASVGVAMASGTDIAMESAGVTLMSSDLLALVRAIHISRATVRNIRQNLFFAFCYNLLGVPVAAGLFYPIFGILLSPMIAAAAMSLSSVSVISNALRLRHLSLPK